MAYNLYKYAVNQFKRKFNNLSSSESSENSGESDNSNQNGSSSDDSSSDLDEEQLGAGVTTRRQAKAAAELIPTIPTTSEALEENEPIPSTSKQNEPIPSTSKGIYRDQTKLKKNAVRKKIVSI